MSRTFLALLVLSIVTLVAGCSSGERIYQLSGAVSFQGKPVPAGTIVFEPDATAGNSGPAGYSKIKDGRYDTATNDGRGTVGGPHLVRIMGLDGIPRGELLNGVPIFPEHTLSADLPKQDATKDFEVKPGSGS